MYIGWTAQRPHQIALKTTTLSARPSAAHPLTNRFALVWSGQTAAPQNRQIARAFFSQ
jgi:hypothetical protein